MIYPEWIKENDTIGVTALSCGITSDKDKNRFNNAKKMLLKENINVMFTDNVFKSMEIDVSSLPDKRGEEFNSLVLDKNVKAIYSAAGGTYLAQMLKYVDIDLFKKNPKWVQGYSDNTGIIHYLTTKCDIATIYGSNFGEFGMKTWQPYVTENLETLKGKRDTFTSYEKCEGKRNFAEENNVENCIENCIENELQGLESKVFTNDVKWINGRNEKEISIEGRLLGGCLDVLFFLTGTKYDGTLDFIEKYKEDGTLWYLETFLANADDFVMNLWHLKELGWFKYAKGIVFGRPLMYESWSNESYEEIVLRILGDLNIPIIFDADFGHLAPRMTMINGAYAKIKSKEGKGELKYIFE